jgi:hypothetical protein
MVMHGGVELVNQLINSTYNIKLYYNRTHPVTLNIMHNHMDTRKNNTIINYISWHIELGLYTSYMHTTKRVNKRALLALRLHQ